MAQLIVAGNATAAQVLAGSTFSAGATTGASGTMPNNGAVTITPSASPQTIAAGYHNGSGTVPAVVVPAANVLTGTTIAGTAGTMPNRGAVNITPSTSAQTIPAGYHDGGGTVSGDADLIATNIRSGIDIFGVVGSLVQGKKYASGSTPIAGSSTTLITSSLTFTPSIILATADTSYTGQNALSVYITGLPVPYNQEKKPNVGDSGTKFSSITSTGFSYINSASATTLYWIAIE